MIPRKDARPGGDEPTHGVDASPPFFRSKLRPPHLPDHSLRRPRLEQLLEDLSDRPVTLVVAPAGAGKTALAATWAMHTELPTAWVTLDASESEPVALWTLLVSALDQLAPGCQARVAPLLRRAELPGVIAVLEEVLEDRGGERKVLVIDNLHHLDADEEASSSFRLFVEHLPERLQLLLLTRHAPDLPVDAMRGSGRLAEIGFAELRFSLLEAAAVLRRLSPAMPEQSVVTVARRADGWAAALQLGALATRAQRATPVSVDRPLTADRMVDEYLWREVLRAESPEIVQVLVDTSVVTWVNAGLAEALTGRRDAAALLVEAERRCLFVTQVSGGWFQVHDLVRDMLLSELSKHPGGRLAEEHVRAARWFEDVGEPVTAVEHWLRGERPDEALRLLAASVTELYDAGRQAALIRLMQRIPASASGRDLASLQNLALCQLLLSRTDFLATVAVIEAFEQADPGASSVLQGRSKILRSMARLMGGHWHDGDELARAGFAQLGPGAMLDPFGRLSWNLVACAIALDERWDDHEPDVLQTKVGLSFDPERRLAWEGTRALGLALAGSPVDALRVAAGASRAAGPTNLTILRAELDLAEGLAMSELGDQPRGRLKLAELAERESAPVSYVQVHAQLGLVEQLLGTGEVAQATTELVRAETLVRELTPSREVMGTLGRVGVLVALAAGDVERAEGWCARISDPFWGPASLARIRFAHHDRVGAHAALVEAVPRCARHEVVHGLLLGVAADSQEAAQKYVAEAIEKAADVGLLETVAAEGYEVRELIERVAWRVPQEWLERLRRRASPPGPGAPQARVATEELTPRELEVLRLLPSRLTLREIAQELYVSQNTLKFHLRLIYRKLAVNSRSEAVVAARSQRLRS